MNLASTELRLKTSRARVVKTWRADQPIHKSAIIEISHGARVWEAAYAISPHVPIPIAGKKYKQSPEIDSRKKVLQTTQPITEMIITATIASTSIALPM